MDHPKAIIDIQQLEIGFQKGKTKKVLLQSINLMARQGELIALVGPNGVGKSTFLKTLCKLHPALSGDIKINNNSLVSFNRKDLAKSLSLVSTEMYRISNLSVFDLVTLGRFPYSSWYGNISENDKAFILSQLEKVGMLNYKDRQVSELSDGEYQRVMIARALAQDTPIIILDEPTAFLDLPNKFSIVNLLWNLTRQFNKTIIFSTHDLNIAMQYADLFWLFKSNGIATGAPEDLLLKGQMEKLFNDSNVYFDADTSQFKVNRTTQKNIEVKGEESVIPLTKMAIHRMGFSTHCNKTTDATVTITTEHNKTVWQVEFGENKTSFYSLTDMQQWIRQTIIN